MSNAEAKIAKIFDCYIISESSLGIECAELILKKKHQIKAIVSNEEAVVLWAYKNNILCIPSIKKFVEYAKEHSVDYLFSIVNNRILPTHILQIPRFLAINYHDSALPKYAGIHATSWAISNNEIMHGISWHVMNERIDAGNILKQVTFPVDKNETALSLNIKCYMYAIEAFKELISDIEYNSLFEQKQILNFRSYFAAWLKPYNCGFIEWSQNAEEIARGYRSLQFGSYNNTLASSKILIEDVVYLINKLEIMPYRSLLYPGCIAKITDNSINVATSTYDIQLSEFSTLFGNPISIEELLDKTGIKEQDILSTPSQCMLKELRSILEDIAPLEGFWKIRLSSINSFYIFPNMLTLSSLKGNLVQAEDIEIFSSSKKISNFTEKQLKILDITFTDILITAFIVYLNRLGNKIPFSVYCSSYYANKFIEKYNSFFANHIPVEFNISFDKSAINIVKYIKSQIFDANNHKTYCYDIIARYPELKSILNSSDKVIINLGKASSYIPFLMLGEILLNIDEDSKLYSIYVKVDTKDAVIKLMIHNFSEHIKNLFYQIVQFPNDSLDNFCFLSTIEKYKILEQGNGPQSSSESSKTLSHLFEKQVEKTPYNIAVIYEGIELTYIALNEKVNQLAHYLRIECNIKADSLVTLYLDRNEHMLISILAVLKAGGAYVPIDPSYPDERTIYIVKDTNTKVLITNRIYHKRLSNILTKSTISSFLYLISVDNNLFQRQLARFPKNNIQTTTQYSNLAYVIYTSGSTGQPKGVMIEHRGIVNRIKWMNSIYSLKESDRILQKTPFIFDVSVWELIWANCYGAAIVFAKPDGHKDSNYLIDLINKEAVTIVHFVPSMFNAFLEAIKVNKVRLCSLRYIFCSGEVLELAQVTDCQKLLSHTKIYNLYGPTETSVDVLYYDCNAKELKQVYIGRPIFNTKVYVLDECKNLLPIGVIGELYIGGVGLARGYLNRPDLTREKFIANPFQTAEEKRLGKNKRLYKTGDLVRWLPDGNLEYIGRNDFQVKIRGFRIELGEIERALSSYEGVRQSVVLAKEQRNRATDSVEMGSNLVGYYVSDSKLDEEKILSYLETKLPEYMVPRVLIYLEKLPLTINGKLDRKALPELKFSTSSNSYIAPRNELEIKICHIWAEVLGLSVDKVGINDDFFKLGGNSILAIKLINALNCALYYKIGIQEILKYRTVKDFVIWLNIENEKKDYGMQQYEF